MSVPGVFRYIGGDVTTFKVTRVFIHTTLGCLVYAANFLSKIEFFY